MLGNGAVLARIGTAAVSMTANLRRIPVIVCCQTFKFTDKVQLDAYVWNEIGILLLLISGDPQMLVTKNNANLQVLNLMYDVTPAESVSAIVTDIGPIPGTSVPVILREYRPIM